MRWLTVEFSGFLLCGTSIETSSVFLNVADRDHSKRNGRQELCETFFTVLDVAVQRVVLFRRRHHVEAKVLHAGKAILQSAKKNQQTVHRQAQQYTRQREEKWLRFVMVVDNTNVSLSCSTLSLEILVFRVAQF